jgi:hypothetical protein
MGMIVPHLEAVEVQLLEAKGGGPWCEWFDGLTEHADRDNAARMLLKTGYHNGLPMVGKSRRQQARYVAMRLDGTGHKLAEMFATQTSPGIMTDSVFLEGHCNGNQFEETPWVGDRYQREAAAAGVDVKGKVYMDGLAAYPGDPRAWVGGRGDVLRVAEERGYTVTGAVNVKGQSRQAEDDVPVADDIVWDRVMDKVEADPSVALRPKEEVFHETREEMKPHWAE